MIKTQDSRLKTYMTKFTSGWRMVKKGTWCAQYSVIPEMRRDIMRKAPPRPEETDGCSTLWKLTCAATTSLWALAWSTLVVTLASPVLADVDER
jgi:hypothetical protein